MIFQQAQNRILQNRKIQHQSSSMTDLSRPITNDGPMSRSVIKSPNKKEKGKIRFQIFMNDDGNQVQSPKVSMIFNYPKEASLNTLSNKILLGKQKTKLAKGMHSDAFCKQKQLINNQVDPSKTLNGNFPGKNFCRITRHRTLQNVPQISNQVKKSNHNQDAKFDRLPQRVEKTTKVRHITQNIQNNQSKLIEYLNTLDFDGDALKRSSKKQRSFKKFTLNAQSKVNALVSKFFNEKQEGTLVKKFKRDSKTSAKSKKELNENKKTSTYRRNQKNSSTLQENIKDENDSKIQVQSKSRSNISHVRSSRRSNLRKCTLSTVNDDNTQLFKVAGQRNWEEDIDYIFKVIKQLKNIGYPERKINGWMGRYWVKRKREIMEIFMNVIKRKTFSQQVYYEFQKSKAQVKEKAKAALFSFADATQEAANKQRKFILRDIKEFSHFVQDILIEKSNQKLKQLEHSIKTETKHCQFYSEVVNFQKKQNKQNTLEQENKRTLKRAPQQIFNLSEDLKNIQQRYGDLKMVSRLNRIRFQQITNSMKTMKELI